MSKPKQLDLLDWIAAQPPCPSLVTAAPEHTPAKPDTVPVILSRVDPACNMRRFYSLALAASLFRECGVVRHWGRIGTSGQIRTDWYEDPGEAASALQALLRMKRKRGYTS